MFSVGRHQAKGMRPNANLSQSNKGRSLCVCILPQDHEGGALYRRSYFQGLKGAMRTRSSRVAAVTAIAAASLSGCAHTYVDAEGSRHVIGLVWAKVPPAGAAAADSLRVRSFGVSAARTPVGTSLVLGYSDTNIVVVRDNQLIDMAPLLAQPQ